MAIASHVKQQELLRARFKAEDDGLTLLQFFRAQIVDHDVSSGAIASTASGANSVSFFSPTANGLTLQENSELRLMLYRICETATAALGASPTLTQVEVQMLEDDWFYGVTGINVDMTCQAR